MVIAQGSRNTDAILTIAEDLGRRPCDASRAGVDTIADELAATTDVVDGVLQDLRTARGLDDCDAVLANTTRYTRRR